MNYCIKQLDCPNKVVLDSIGLGFKHLTRKPS